MNYKTDREDSEQGKYKPITHVFAYKTGTFDNELPERKYEPIPKHSILDLVRFLLPFKERV
ncbi:MAG: hypothetical protein AABW56_04415 [Nanoarchaeota archaeon]